MLYNVDCLEGYGMLEDQSVKLQIIDPPYFSTKMKSVGDNQWKTEEKYVGWFESVLKEVKRTLSKNGSIYLFHNDEDIMIDILHFCKHSLGLHLQNQITWNKFPTHNNFSRVVKTFGKNRRYGKTFSEKIYFLTSQPEYYETPFSRIIQSQIDLGFSKNDISNLFLSKNGNPTGWLFNKMKGTQIPTRQQWSVMCDFFNIPDQYDDLVKRHAEERYPFNQEYVSFSGKTISEQKELLKPYSDIWEYAKDDSWHPTRKPYEMIENIVYVSSNHGDLVVDPFAGSGVTLDVCRNLSRRCISFENNLDFYKRIKND